MFTFSCAEANCHRPAKRVAKINTFNFILSLAYYVKYVAKVTINYEINMFYTTFCC